MYKILVIEDNPSVRESIVDLLEMRDYEVFTACNGEDGIHMVKACKPSLVLCDIMMPKKSGHEVLQEVRNQSITADIPFIFLSAKSQTVDLREGMNLGADDYLTKPFKAKELFHAIDTRLKKNELTRASIKAKEKSKEPMGNQIFTGNLIAAIQQLIDESGFVNEHFEKLNQDEVKSSIQKLAKHGKSIKKIAYKTAIYHQLALINFDEEVKAFFTEGFTSNLQNLTKKIAIPIAEEYDREYDLYFKEIAAAKLPIPNALMTFILSELVENAFKFSQPKSLITIEGVIKDNQYYFSVEDKGKGISPTLLDELGSKPIINENSFKLGIFLVKSIIDYNAGTLTTTSDVEKGTKIVLKFEL